MPSCAAQGRLAVVASGWWVALQHWAATGRFSAAVQEALLLSEAPKALKELETQLTLGDVSALPPLELLPADAMDGALGAYAAATGTIYLNADWLMTADDRAVQAVLTEELGHHLDALLNACDTP